MSLSPRVRALIAPAAFAGALALGGCNVDGSYDLPSRAMKDLSPEMLAQLEKKGMPKESPILVRIFKEESELEVWKARDDGRFYHFKTYPICNWSGAIGPKTTYGDHQAPEGFRDASGPTSAGTSGALPGGDHCIPVTRRTLTHGLC